MLIVGHGLIARSLALYAGQHEDAIAFATGVSDSSCIDPDAFERERALLHRTLDEARPDGRRVIYFSGAGAIYGRWEGAATESSPLEPKSPYGRHQLTCESIIAGAGVPYLIVRLPNVVGPAANPRQLLPSLVRQALGGRVRVQLNAMRDIIDVRDVGRVVSQLLDRVRDSKVVIVASGSSVPAYDIVQEICRILAIEPALILEPGGDAQRFSTERLRRLLGYDPFPDALAYRVILQTHVPALASEVDGPASESRFGSPG